MLRGARLTIKEKRQKQTTKLKKTKSPNPPAGRMVNLNGNGKEQRRMTKTNKRQ
jgi:hypothetical protein